MASEYDHLYAKLKQTQSQLTGIPPWVQPAEALLEKKKAVKTAAHLTALEAKKVAAVQEKAILHAEHFTVGLGTPLKKESRNE